MIPDNCTDLTSIGAYSLTGTLSGSLCTQNKLRGSSRCTTKKNFHEKSKFSDNLAIFWFSYTTRDFIGSTMLFKSWKCASLKYICTRNLRLLKFFFFSYDFSLSFELPRASFSGFILPKIDKIPVFCHVTFHDQLLLTFKTLEINAICNPSSKHHYR